MNSRLPPATLSVFDPAHPGEFIASRRQAQAVPTGPRRMGQALLESGQLTLAQIEQIVRTQTQDHLRFGEAAVQLGFLTQADVDAVLARQFDYQTAGEGQLQDRQIDPSLAIAHHPQGVQAEAIRRFRSEILVRLGEQRHLMLAIVSPQEGEGKSHVAASLAVAFAQLHIPTLLIDANLRQPRQHQLFDLNNQSGLSTMLAGRSEATMAATTPVLPDLRVLCAGPRPPNPSELLSGPRLGELLIDFAADAPIIILDTAASNDSSDAQIVAQGAGRALIVGRQSLSRMAALKRCHQDMEAAGVRVLGSFYNNPPPPRRWAQRLIAGSWLGPALQRLRR